MSAAAGGMLLLFPGQGSQAPGMGSHLLATYSVARETYAEAGDLLGWDVAGLCRAGTIEELTRTDRAQLCLLVTSVATLRILCEVGLDFDVALGHSLGEYSALVATGHLSFASALRVVRCRGEHMQACGERRPGTMAAVIGLDDAVVEHICAGLGDVWPANYNSPGQVVISGGIGGVESASRMALERGARRVVPLTVSGAFHTPYMQEAAEAVYEALASDPIDAGPRGPDRGADRRGCFFSTTELRYPAPGELKDVLARQVVSPVRFRQAVELLAPSMRQGIEVGPGEVLCGLAKRSARELAVASTGSEAALARVLEEWRLQAADPRASREVDGDPGVE